MMPSDTLEGLFVTTLLGLDLGAWLTSQDWQRWTLGPGAQRQAHSAGQHSWDRRAWSQQRRCSRLAGQCRLSCQVLGPRVLLELQSPHVRRRARLMPPTSTPD